MKIATNVTFTIQSDVSKSPSGIIYAKKPANSQQDAVVWVADLTFVDSAINRLAEEGYDASSLVFVPYSSKANWSATHPFLMPTLECDSKGFVSINMYRNAAAGSVATAYTSNIPSLPTMDSKPADDSAAKPKKKKRGGPRLYKNAILTNDLRDELHIQIYRYFQWLLVKSTENESTFNGRRCLNENKLTVLGIQSMLSTIESALPIVKSIPLEPNLSNYPLLEEVIEEQLGQLADFRTDQSNPPAHQGQWFDFDEMFQRLQEYKLQKGDCNVPHRWKEDRRLGKWVNKLREKKSDMKKRGLEWEELTNKKSTSRTLTKERVDMLDSLGFVWSFKTKPVVSWEDRYQALIEFYQINGRWPSRKDDGSLGHWVHNQRNLCAKRDKHFMKERYAKLIEIGFDFDPTGKRAANTLSWDDGFAKLVQFGNAHGHFNVPPPFDEKDKTTKKFFKWVQSLHTEYRSIQNGGLADMLVGDRISTLLSIGFQFQT